MRSMTPTKPAAIGGLSPKRNLDAPLLSGNCTNAIEYRSTTRSSAYFVTREDAEDALQRCFQRAFTNLARFRGDAKFSTWVTRIAINEALMILRQRRASTPLPETSYEDPAGPVVLNLADRAPTPNKLWPQTNFVPRSFRRCPIFGRTCAPSFCSANFKDSRTRRPPNVSV
jgi:Sigma-70 region 2